MESVNPKAQVTIYRQHGTTSQETLTFTKISFLIRKLECIKKQIFTEKRNLESDETIWS